MDNIVQASEKYCFENNVQINIMPYGQYIYREKLFFMDVLDADPQIRFLIPEGSVGIYNFIIETPFI